MYTVKAVVNITDMFEVLVMSTLNLFHRDHAETANGWFSVLTWNQCVKRTCARKTSRDTLQRRQDIGSILTKPVTAPIHEVIVQMLMTCYST